MKKPVIILIHIGYWLLYLLLICLIFTVLGLHQLQNKPFDAYRFVTLIFASPITAITIATPFIAFYLFYTILFPRFLQTKKIGLALLVGILFCFLASLGGWAFLFLNPGFKSPLNQPFALFGITGIMMLLAKIHGIIALVIRGFISWYADIKIKEELTQQNHATEMALIKAQLDPHFLFNSLNNIDVLITKDSAKASAYLNKLSAIMRYMLYETKAESTSLCMELTYIEKYFDLQGIRTANPDFIEYTVNGNCNTIMTAPMLFMPFIENAFKHTANIKQGVGIKVSFNITPEEIYFDCSNLVNIKNADTNNSGGLGNQLILRRLELLYPNKHRINISATDTHYTVQLSIFSNAS